MKKSNKKLFLSIAALLLAVMTAVGFTYAWIDDVKQVQFQNDNLADGSPLKAGVDINSTVNITKDNNCINLGNIIQPSDITIQNYEYEEGYTAPHATYPQNAQQATAQQEFIDENKGYFYESGDMHLSPCYSDGETFYFPKGSSSYREGNKDDENVNYISFTAKVCSPDANVDFWFGTADADTQNTATPPTVKDQNGDAIPGARIAITVDGSCHVYSAGGTASTYNPSSGQIESVSGVRSTTAYTYNHTDNNPSGTGKNGNTLFSIKKGATVNMNIKIWLEGGTTGVTLSDIDINLVSSWAFSRKITIVDKTTTNSSASWINNDGAKLYLTLSSLLNEKESDVYKWSRYRSDKLFYELTEVGNTKTYEVTVPMIFNNEEIILYRCTDLGWDMEETEATGADNAVERSPYDVYCWNWWKSNIPNTFKDESYTLYGSSFDSVVTSEFGGTATNKGYGTWGNVVEIIFDGKSKSIDSNGTYGNGDNLATVGGNLFLVDQSDYKLTNEKYIYVMYPVPNTTTWKTYVPESSQLIQFKYRNGDIEVYWGYDSWWGKNPQMRPDNSFTYYATQHVKHNDWNITKEGVGFWDGADKVYLIKNGIFAGNSVTTLRCRTFYSSKNSSANSGYINMQITDETFDNAPVYWDNHEASKTPAHYYRVTFDKGSTDSGSITNEMYLYPGCYYNPATNEWYGSLHGNGRSAATSGDGESEDPGEDESGTETLDGYTIDSGLRFKVSENEKYTVYQKSDGSNKYKVQIPITGTSQSNPTNYTLVKNSDQYGLGNNYSSYQVPFNDTIYLVKGQQYNFGFWLATTQTPGQYIISLEYQYVGGDTIVIKEIGKAVTS